MITSRYMLRWIRNVSDKFVQKIEKRIFKNCAFYNVIWKNTWNGQAGHRWQHNMAHVLCTQDNYGYRDTLVMYEIIIAFPRQQWLSERTSTLHYTYFSVFVTGLTQLLYIIPSMPPPQHYLQLYRNHHVLLHTNYFIFIFKKWLHLNVIYTIQRCCLPQEGTITVTV
jgi:hypothetical protein